MNMNEDLAKKLFEQEMMMPNLEETGKAAKSMYALYKQFIDSGFTKVEAMQLLTTIIGSGLGAKR